MDFFETRVFKHNGVQWAQRVNGERARVIGTNSHEVAVQYPRTGEFEIWRVSEVAKWEKEIEEVPTSPPPATADKDVERVRDVFLRFASMPCGPDTIAAQAAATLTLAYFVDRACDWISELAPKGRD